MAERTTSTGTTQGTTGVFDATECFSATDLTMLPTTCDSSSPEFSTSMNIVLATALPAQSNTIADSLKTMPALIGLGVVQAE